MYDNLETINVDIKDRVATVTINRPEVGNAIGKESYIEIRDTFEALGKDPSVGAIVLTGAGKHFSTGGDIHDFRKIIDDKTFIEEERVHLTGEMSAAIRRCPKPVVAMVNGAAAGAGASLAFACDFRVLEEGSKFIMAFINLGLTGDSCGAYYLSRMIGTAKAIELMMLGQPLDAAKADALGLAYKVVPRKDLEEETYKLAKRLANGPTSAYAYQKEEINRFFFPDLEECNALESSSMAAASRSDDFAEAVDAFLSKRKPVFTGK